MRTRQHHPERWALGAATIGACIAYLGGAPDDAPALAIMFGLIGAAVGATIALSAPRRVTPSPTTFHIIDAITTIESELVTLASLPETARNRRRYNELIAAKRALQDVYANATRPYDDRSF